MNGKNVYCWATKVQQTKESILLGHKGAANERKYGPNLNKYFKISPTSFFFFNLLFGQDYVMLCYVMLCYVMLCSTILFKRILARVIRCEWKSWVWQRDRQRAYWCLLSALIIVTILQRLVLSFNAQSWKIVRRDVKEMVSHWTGVMVDRRCEGNTVILWHVSEKSRFKSDG